MLGWQPRAREGPIFCFPQLGIARGPPPLPTLQGVSRLE